MFDDDMRRAIRFPSIEEQLWAEVQVCYLTKQTFSLSRYKPKQSSDPSKKGGFGRGNPTDGGHNPANIVCYTLGDEGYMWKLPISTRTRLNVVLVISWHNSGKMDKSRLWLLLVQLRWIALSVSIILRVWKPSALFGHWDIFTHICVPVPSFGRQITALWSSSSTLLNLTFRYWSLQIHCRWI